MMAWLVFWTLCLLLAGASFAAITVVVTVRGAKDLRQMFDRLRRQKETESV